MTPTVVRMIPTTGMTRILAGVHVVAIRQTGLDGFLAARSLGIAAPTRSVSVGVLPSLAAVPDDHRL